MKIATPHANPIGCRWWQSQKQGGSADWMWNRTGEEIANDYFEMARVEFESAVDDLLQLHDNPIVVDAFLAFPELVFKAAHPEGAVFLVSTDEFQRQSWTERMNEGHPTHKGFRDRMNTCSDPESALKNQIESSIIESKFMADDCERRGATLIVTGGRIDIEEAYSSVKKHFHLK